MAKKRYWIGVAGAANFDVLRKGGFSVFAVGDRFAKVMSSMRRGNSLLIYKAGGAAQSGFSVVASVMSDPYRQDGRDFPGIKSFPYRVNLKLELDVSDNPVKISEIADRLDFVKKKQIPGTYLQTHLREIDAHDHDAIAKTLEMRASAKTEL